MSGDVQVRFCERPRVRFPRATHLVVVVDPHWRNHDLWKKVEQRIREEIGKLKVDVNEGKSRVVNLKDGETFCFLGSTFVASAQEPIDGCR